MKSIEELYDEVREKFPNDSLEFVWHIVCRKYAKKAIERAAEKAEITIEIVSETPAEDGLSIDVESSVIVNKQTILSVIDELT